MFREKKFKMEMGTNVTDSAVIILIISVSLGYHYLSQKKRDHFFTSLNTSVHAFYQIVFHL